uniref:HMG box domain containing 3 n=1 Tax=Neolamprologus brichardi TaxID=32507 RepID=A0A3Q4GVT8_NEOBR
NMDKVELFEVVKVTEEVESAYSQMEVTSFKKRKNLECVVCLMSAYLLYYFDVHQIMQLGVSNMPQSEINKRISESWKRLSVAEKSYYLEKAKLEKEGVDTSSVSPSKDLPGFRKILPRTSYFVLSKGCSSSLQPGSSQSELSIESTENPPENGLPSVSLIQEARLTPLGLAGKVELSEHPIVVDEIKGETAVVSPALQGIPPASSSSSVSPKATSVKTYTRRGRGRCLTPGCSFIYVTRHKPPTCPECGSHLGGKWIPAVKNFSGLKPSTLKQLGQAVPTTTDLGLSTARGRGRCKNPSCDYIYKNRHKPAVCPKCGCELTQKNAKATKQLLNTNVLNTLLYPYNPLSPAQKDIQRQNTVQLLRSSLQIPENETELQETLTLIQELNTFQVVFVQVADQEQENSAEAETMLQSRWPQYYESAATHCGLCNYPLFKGDQSTVAGQENCWLLTETLMQTVSLQLKVCLNVQCLALHSFTDLHPGLFNIGNRLLVSIDLFLKIRASIKLGQSPSQAAKTIVDHVPSHPVHSLNPDESSQIQELLLSGYWAFECLTVRDYNDMICGICGVAPKIEIAQRYTNNVLELKNVEFTWPEFSVSDEVHVDDFWLTMESEAIEQAAFPTDIPITRVDASIIAPFIPPLMRSPTVINTEKDKVLPHPEQSSGDPSVLVRLIHDSQLRLDKIEDHTEDELRKVLDCCGANITPGSTKNELLASLISLYAVVHSGLSTAPQPPAHLTAGKLSKVCPHKVMCASKYLVKGETARDHVDLLLSSRYWPPVYVCDSARQVALCADLQYPQLAKQMWGRNQGCFSDPFEKPVVCDSKQSDTLKSDSTESSSSVPSVSRALKQPIVFNNTAYYYLYNRLVDFLTSRDIVSQQISQVVKACQPGEVVIRDSLYRLGVAQIKTDGEEDEGSGVEGQAQEEGIETFEVVLDE